MTREQLQRCDAQLRPLAPGAPPDSDTIRELRIFNENVNAVRRTLLEPARSQFDRSGAVEPDLAIRLARAVQVLGPWKDTLLEAIPTLRAEDSR